MTKHDPQGSEDVWCAIAVTEHGRIPGKAKDGTCWYGYGGEEHTTENFKIIKSGTICKEPEGQPLGEQSDGSGFYWNAICRHEDLKIPGKADADGNAWYSYGGEEIECSDFRYICQPVNRHKAQGWQNDDAGDYWCAIANTEYGPIPGKARGDTCWYPYGGEEHETDDFEIIKQGGLSEEPRGDPHAEQEDGAKIWCAVAQTEHGRIPCKANEDGCWYPYGGEELESDNFRFVYKHEQKPQGDQEGMELWCAVANTDEGAIPGKSDGENCWYSYGGEEKDTTDFTLVKDGGLSKDQTGAAHGMQLDGCGKLWCAVANTEWGRIPGKAKDGQCWYPYGGEEHETDDFDYVFARRFVKRAARSMNDWDDYSCSSGSFDDSDDEDDVPTFEWRGSYYSFNRLIVNLGIDEEEVVGSGTDNGNPFEIEGGERDGRDIKFVMKFEDGEEKYYWGELTFSHTNIFGNISSEGFDGESEMASLRKC